MKRENETFRICRRTHPRYSETRASITEPVPDVGSGCGGDAAQEVVLFGDGFGADGEGVEQVEA
jgi:hypothetical protein